MSTTTTLHPLAEQYLKRLRNAGRRLPRAILRDLTADIEAHLLESTGPEMSDAEVLTVLDRLGEPEDIVDAQQPPAADRRGIHEWAAIILLLFGGFIFGVGWIIGLILLWSSRAWTTRDKWIGTLVAPGGFASVWILLVLVSSVQSCYSSYPSGVEHCTGGPSTGQQILGFALLAFFVLGPIVSAVYLARRAR
jgi:hypothetical protein